MKTTHRNVFKYLAMVLALTVIVAGSTTLIRMNSQAAAETTKLAGTVETVVTSPFTAPVQLVKNSVVGVNNYRKTSSYGSGGFNFGFGFDFGYGGGGRGNEDSTREVLYSSGSGVVIANGYVLTNFHVVENATTLEVTAGDASYPATLAGSDANLDVAILKVENLNLPAVTLGDSDKLMVGDWAICIGNPLSFTGTTTVGIISALDRQITDTSYDRYGRRVQTTYSMIQTDAAINSGNSGGGMFNIAGELVGIPTMKYTGSAYSTSARVEGIGMSIPINNCKPLIDEVLGGKVTQAPAQSGDEGKTEGKTEGAPTVTTSKPRIGVSIGEISTANGVLPTGAYVSKVEEGSPAQAAGIQVGDIIVDIDGEVITSTSQAISIIQSKNAGYEAKVKVYRVEGLADIVSGKTQIQSYSDIPDGEYIDLTVVIEMMDTTVQQ